MGILENDIIVAPYSGNIYDCNVELLGSFRKGKSPEPKVINLSVYPNPAKVKIVIEGIEASQFSVQLRDIHGRIVGMYENMAKIDIQHLGAGIYFAVVISEGKIEKKVFSVL